MHTHNAGVNIEWNNSGPRKFNLSLDINSPRPIIDTSLTTQFPSAAAVCRGGCRSGGAMDELQNEWIDTFSVEAVTEICEPDEDDEPDCFWLEETGSMGL